MASNAFLTKAYLAYFGRPVDQTGAIAFGPTSNVSEAAVQNAFFASAESQSLYGATFGIPQVNAVYNMLFNRDAEPAGLAYWVNQVAVGLLTPAGAAIGIMNGALNADKVAVNNKLVSSAAFFAAVDTTPEILAYSGDSAANAARAFLKTVTTAPADAAVVTNVVAALTASGSATAGYSLTNGTDIASANVFNAGLVFTPAGNTRINSLQDEDTLTGTGTNPTLNVTLGNTGDNGGNIITPKLLGISIVNAAFTGSGNVGNVSAGAVRALDLQDATGLTEVNITRVAQGNSAEVGNMKSAVSKMSVTNTNANQADTIEFSFATDALVGVNTATMTLSSVDLGALNIGQNTSGINLRGVGINGVENLTLNSVGATNTVRTLNLPMDTGTAGKLIITGDQDLTLASNVNVSNGVAPNAALVEAVVHGGGVVGAAGRLSAIDASAFTGDLTLNIAAGTFTTGKADTSGVVQNVTITGGTGDDTFYLADTIQAGDSLTGGAGNDTIIITTGGNINASSSVVTLIENVRVELDASPAATATVDFTKLPDVTAVTVRNVSNDNAGAPVSNAAGVATYNLNNLTAVQGNAITVEHSTTGSNGILQNVINAKLAVASGAADTVSVTIVDNTNVDPRFGFIFNAGDVAAPTTAANRVESITINDNDTESNTVALGFAAQHTGTVTLKGGVAGTFLNLDTTTTGTNGGLYNYIMNGTTGVAGPIGGVTGDGFAGGGTTGVMVAGVTDQSATGGQVKLVAAVIDASAEVSNVVVRVSTANQVNATTGAAEATATGGQLITMGAGNDTVIFDNIDDNRAGLTISDTVIGGAGNDTLVIDGNLGVAGVINISASEWTNVSGFETISLVNPGAGSTYALTLTNALIAANNSNGILAFVNDHDTANDTANTANTAGTVAEVAVVIDARSLSATARFSYNGEEGTTATADRFILSDANINGGNVIDGGAANNNNGLIATAANLVTGTVAGVTYDTNAGVVAGNTDVMEIRNAAVVTIGDLANLKNIGTLSFTNDTASVQNSVLQLNDTIVDALVNSYHTSSATAIGGVSQVETLFVNTVDNALTAGAFTTLNLDASALTAKSSINVITSGGADTIVGGAGADFINGGRGADVLTGGAGADVFRFSKADGSAAINGVVGSFTGFDTVLDFTTAQLDRISLNSASIILNGAFAPLATIANVATTAFDANGAVGVALITGATAGDLTNIANVIAAIGAIANETVGESAYFIVNNTAGTQSGIYAFTSTSVVVPDSISANELTLIGVTTGQVTLAGLVTA